MPILPYYWYSIAFISIHVVSFFPTTILSHDYSTMPSTCTSSNMSIHKNPHVTLSIFNTILCCLLSSQATYIFLWTDRGENTFSKRSQFTGICVAAWRAEAARSALPHKFQYCDRFSFYLVLWVWVTSVGTFCFATPPSHSFSGILWFFLKSLFQRKFYSTQGFAVFFSLRGFLHCFCQNLSKTLFFFSF